MTFSAPWMFVLMHSIELLELIAGIHDELLGPVALQDRSYVLPAKRTGAPGYQDRFAVEHVLSETHRSLAA
jgi:hypothetical protein